MSGNDDDVDDVVVDPLIMDVAVVVDGVVVYGGDELMLLLLLDVDFCKSDISFRSWICMAFCKDCTIVDPLRIDWNIDVVTRTAPPSTYVPNTNIDIMDIVIRVRSVRGLDGDDDDTSVFVGVGVVASVSNGESSMAFCNLRNVSRNTAGNIIKKPR